MQRENIMQMMRKKFRNIGILARLAVLAYLLVISIVLRLIGAYILLVKNGPLKLASKNRGRRP